MHENTKTSTASVPHNGGDSARPASTRAPGVPSRRAIGVLVAGALALGLVAGAALAPSPPSSLASSSTVVTRLLALLAAGADTRAPSASPATRPAQAAATPPLAAAGHAHARETAAARTASGASSDAEAPPSSGEAGSGSSSAEAGSGESEKKKTVRLPPISHVWLVLAGGSGFAQARASAASYPYLTGTLLEHGMLLERYSAIEAYELAGDASLLTGGIGESLSTISEPCGAASATTGGASTVGAGSTAGSGAPASNPSGAGSAASGAPASCSSAMQSGGQAEADAFLQRALTPILASSAYGERGLIVITFGAGAQEQGLSAATLDSSPPAGALLLSPTLKAGSHSSEAFDSLAPRESLEAIFAAS